MHEGDDVGALAGVEAAAMVADEEFERALAFADGDRMPLPHLVGIIVRDLRAGVAARERRGEREHGRAAGERGGEPVTRAGRELGHGTVLLSSGQSRMNP